MISNVFSHCIFVSCFKKSQACNLVQVIFFLSHYDSSFLLCNSVRINHLCKIFFIVSFKWTTMVFTLAWLCQSDGLCTIPWLVIITFSLLTVAVSNVIGVILLKFFTIDVFLFCKLSFPKLKRLFHSKSYALQKETHLKSSIMFKVVLLF